MSATGTRRGIPEEGANLVYSIAETIDEFTNNVAGIKPASTILGVLRPLAPANVISSITKLPRPSDVIEPKITEALDNLRTAEGRLWK